MSAPRRVVLDTHIWLELLHFHDPRVDAINRALQDGSWIALRCAQTEAELARVATRHPFASDSIAAARLTAEHRQRSQLVVVPSPPPLPRCRDPDDQQFLVLAATQHADLLITRDRDLLRLAGTLRNQFGVQVLPPEKLSWDCLRAS